MRNLRAAAIPFVLAVLLAVLAAPTAHAALGEPPSIEKILADPRYPAHVCLLLEHAAAEAAESFDGGRNFKPIKAAEIPVNFAPAPTTGEYRYAKADYLVFRSEDGGATWQDTDCLGLIVRESRRGIEASKRYFMTEYGRRIPQRSAYWTFWFLLFACAHLGVSAFLLRASGWARVAWSLARSILLLAIAWSALTWFHFVFIRWPDPHFQWPLRFYQSDFAFDPSAKLGVILNVAARPLPLLCFLLCIIPILPASVDGLSDCLKRRKSGRRWPQPACWSVALLLWACVVFAVICPWPFGYFFGG